MVDAAITDGMGRLQRKEEKNGVYEGGKHGLAKPTDGGGGGGGGPYVVWEVLGVEITRRVNVEEANGERYGR